MRYKVIACKVMTRELGWLSAICPNCLDITYLRQGYHDEPKKLKTTLMEEIKRFETGDDPYSCTTDVGEFDAILLLYGLCCNGIEGLYSEKYPIVVPKAHDCITLLLGSRAKYDEYFEKNPGTFWYTPGWIENCLMPSKEYKDFYYNQYVQKYGEDNAKFLLENFLSWVDNYTNAAYIRWEGLEQKHCEDYTEECAKHLGWKSDYLAGNAVLLKDLLWGNWDDERFLIVPPKHVITPSFDTTILTHQPMDEYVSINAPQLNDED